MTKPNLQDKATVDVVLRGRKPSDVAHLHFANNRRSYYNPKEGDTELKVSFNDDRVDFHAEAWYEASDCSDGAHGWKYASKTNHGEDGEEPAFRSDCGNFDASEAQVKKLVASLQEWLALRKAKRGESS